MKVLLTGFEPFGKHAVNPSQKLINELPDTLDDDIVLIKTVLPVDQASATRDLLFQLHHHQPDVAICFGLASGRSRICLERVAINLMDFQIPDNDGVKISEAPIIENGPAAYFTNLPISDLLSTLLDEGIQARISLTAGAFLCNLVFYSLMHEIETSQLPTKAGFIHLPPLPEQAALSDKSTPSLSLEKDVLSALLIIKFLYQNLTSK
ncbi:MAG: pyroglutamyl-peptidase I [Chloroflexota bacterium]|nr:pyroglutamyl-peptidase I [Chloroflexota bacterium]